MKLHNITGLAYYFFPGTITTKIIPDVDITFTGAYGTYYPGDVVSINDKSYNKVIPGNRLVLFSGIMPSTGTFYEENKLDDIIAANSTKVLQEFNLELTYTFDRERKERTIRATADALPFTHNNDGAPTWFAIKLTEDKNWDGSTIAVEAEETLVMSDKIGLWDDATAALVLEDLGSVTGNANIMKSFTIQMQDALSGQEL